MTMTKKLTPLSTKSRRAKGVTDWQSGTVAGERTLPNLEGLSMLALLLLSWLFGGIPTNAYLQAVS